MDKGQAPGGVRHLPSEIKESTQYKQSLHWNKGIRPGSHASKQRDYILAHEGENSD